MDKAELQSLIDQAFDAFWGVIAKRFPEATTGDLSPWATIRLDDAAHVAVSEWIHNNVPTMHHD